MYSANTIQMISCNSPATGSQPLDPTEFMVSAIAEPSTETSTSRAAPTSTAHNPAASARQTASQRQRILAATDDSVPGAVGGVVAVGHGICLLSQVTLADANCVTFPDDDKMRRLSTATAPKAR